MGLHYYDLTARTRELMTSEIEADMASGEGVYISSYFNPREPMRILVCCWRPREKAQTTVLLPRSTPCGHSDSTQSATVRVGVGRP